MKKGLFLLSILLTVLSGKLYSKNHCTDVSSLQQLYNNMHNGTDTVYCSQAPVAFYDPGGPNGNYGNYQDYIQTFVASDPSMCLSVTFTSFHLESSYYDYLKVYDGTNTSATPLATLGGSNIPESITSSTGKLTFVFHSDVSLNYSGWAATISCVECPPPAPPPPSDNPCDPNGIHPFCTDENPYGVVFPSGMSGNGSTFLGSSGYSCLGSTPYPAWYYMQISDPGDLLIYIQQVSLSGGGLDVDFVCWGPFSATSQSNFVENLCNGVYSLNDLSHGSHRPPNGNHQNDMGGYPYGNVVDCSYHSAPTEWCFIPNAQQGEWYLLLITNYSRQAGTISFGRVDQYSTATTNCNLLAPISYNDPLCVGDTLVLTCENPINNATYHWSGPGGWTDSTTVPSLVIPNVTTDQSGRYTLHITGTESYVDSSGIDVTIHEIPQILITAPDDTICAGTNATLSATGAESYHWSSTTSTNSNITVAPTSTTTYSVTGTDSYGCSNTDTFQITVLPATTGDTTATVCNSFEWYGSTYNQSGSYTTHLTNAAGCDSLVTLQLTVNPPTESTLNVSVIQNNLPYTLNDSSYSEPGIYLQTLTSATDCDSLLTIHLTVFYNVTSQVDTTVCVANMPYTWHGHSYATAGSFTDTLLTSHGADSVVTYQLAVDGLSAAIGNVTHVTCHGGSTGAATATATSGQGPMTYSWTNVAGTNVSTSTSVSNCPAGLLTFTVTDNLGCTATDTVTLQTLNTELTPGTIADDQGICIGETIAPFTGTAGSGGDNGTYQWQISDNGTDWTTAPGTSNAQTYTYPDIAVSDFMLRRAWVSQSCGTIFSNILTVTILPKYSDTITAAICIGEVYQENGFNITSDQTAEAGEYSYEILYTTGHCDSLITLQLSVFPKYEETWEDEICEGDNYTKHGFAVSPLETMGVDSLLRTLSLQTVNGCDSIVFLRLSIIDTALRIVSLTADFCEEQSAELMVATQMPDYLWTTGETTPNITVTAPGLYMVTASQNDCHNTAHIRIENCPNELFLPNAISPSRGDGLNDYFCIPEINQRDLSQFEISIYNRWGELVFFSTDKNFKWNGEFRGQIHYETTYVYILQYTDLNGKPHKVTGNITVL